MEYIAIVLVTIMTLGSQLILKKAIVEIGPLMEVDKMAFFMAAFQSPYVIGAIVMQGMGFFLWIFVLTKLKLGVAFAFSGALFYILIAIASYYLYGEQLTLMQWIGLCLISGGVVLMNLAAL